MLLWASQASAIAAWRAGRLESLDPELQDGILVTWGRFTGDRLFQLTGKRQLPVLLGQERLAQLYAICAHESGHFRDVAGILSRVRRWVWLVGGRQAAQKAARSCMPCRLQHGRPQQQLMGQVPGDLGRISAPFEICSLDLFGPLLAKGMGGYARKSFKTWGVLFTCTSSRAISIWLAAGYSSLDFLNCLRKQIAIYGTPRKILSDQGSQLSCAASELKEWGAFVEGARECGVEWVFTPAGCAWRNGQAERAVGLAKHCLRQQVEAHELLSFTELESAVLEVAAIVNKRPLTVRLYEDDEFFPVCPADLLLGRMGAYLGTREEIVDEVAWPERVKHVDKFVTAWWGRWQAAAFQLFTPRQKWTQRVRPVKEGDIVLLQGDGKLKKGEYRLGLVKSLQPSADGQVRTVVLTLHERRRRRGVACTRDIPMGVQRLVVLLPYEERWAEGVVDSRSS